MTSVANLCTWISVGNCVFAGPVLRAGEKGASMNLEAVQLYECSPVSERIFPGWPNFLTLHVTSSNLHMAGSHQTYTTHLEELGGGALGTVLHRQKMTMAPQGVPLLHGGRGLGWMCRWALRQPSSAGPSARCLASSHSRIAQQPWCQQGPATPHLIRTQLGTCAWTAHER